ncbi:SDR family NAD(P)-dependent oxidoreductase [Nocardia altamirensis]|uniref:SDR family NAD(P)-dependent oxidoreductase n=1 Tax=Nocardia altamirensis TaxID=472158 RepID=UPI00084067EE|nr:SDR family NAD(P)-dependent oxidoreductase [Nocardia altamirensis]
MPRRFEGLRCLVTGGTRGIGHAVAERLAIEGGHVTITGRDIDSVGLAADSLAAATGGHVQGLACDLSDPDLIRAMTDEIGCAGSPLDVLINNAGTATINRFTDITLEELDTVLSVNLRGTFLLTQQCVRMMFADDANIVNVSSQAGYQGQPLVSHYSASKAALLGLTKSLAKELAPRIRVNAVCPGIIETDLIEADFLRQSEILDQTPGAVRDRTLGSIPLGRFQAADRIAAAVAYLGSREAADITGQTVHVSGGMTMT